VIAQKEKQEKRKTCVRISLITTDERKREEKKRMTQIYTRVDKNRKERCTQILVVKTRRKERKKERRKTQTRLFIEK
jgi:hypothetical protein